MKLLTRMFLLVLTAFVLVTAACAAHKDTDIAYPVTSGNIYFNKESGTVTDCDESVTEAVIPAQIDGVPVTAIGDGAFEGLTGLTSVEISNGVTSIGYDAFCGCTSLTSVKIPASLTSIGEYAFQECTSLTSIDIPSNVASIEDFAFCGCTSLTSVEIPASVTSIGDGVFGECTSLTNINVANGNWNYVSADGILFNKSKTDLLCYPAGRTELSYQIPASVTYFGYSAFYGCANLTSVEIPASITYIINSAFWKCRSLTQINVASDNTNYVSENGILFNKGKTDLLCYPAGKTELSYQIPASVTSIGRSAFFWCTSLTSVEIPASVTSIGENAFSGCTNLTSVQIPNSVTSIGKYAFSWCDSLRDVYYAGSREQWKRIANINGSGLVSESITIHYESPFEFNAATGTVTDYDESATQVIIPAQINGVAVISIGKFAFSNCTSLTDVEIPASVTSIEQGAFDGCVSLTGMEIPASVTSIGAGAFGGCTSLTDIHVASGNPNYASVSGILFDKSKTTLMGYPAGKPELSYQIPASVTSIELVAFSRCANLTSVKIPNGVTSIEAFAFESCTSLTSVEIPANVTSIGAWAFYGCDNLCDVYYEGNREQWDKISGISNSKLISESITIHYNATMPDTPTVPKFEAKSAPTVGGRTVSKADLSGLTQISVPVSISADTPTSVTVSVPFFNGGKFVGMGFVAATVDKNTTSVTVPVTGNVSGAEKMNVIFLDADFRPLSTTGFDIAA